MRVVHVANFYGQRSGGLRTTMHELGRGYLAAGHEFVMIVPGQRQQIEHTDFGVRMTLPSLPLVGTRYGLFQSNSESGVPSPSWLPTALRFRTDSPCDAWASGLASRTSQPSCFRTRS